MATENLQTYLAHLNQVLADPSQPLDAVFILKLSVDVTQESAPILAPQLVPVLVALLSSVAEDLNLLVDLILKLLTWTSFTDCLKFTSPENLELALRSPSPHINHLALALLSKAASHASDAAIVAGMRDVVLSLVEISLENPDTGVASEAIQTLQGLLTVDRPDQDQASFHGQGLMWRRIFEDKAIYSSFFSISTPAHSRLGEKAATIAQSRLLGFVSFLASSSFDFALNSHFPDVEAEYHLAPGSGLLDFASRHLQFAPDDILMKTTLISFFGDLLKALPSTGNRASKALSFLIDRRIHMELVKLYLSQDSPTHIINAVARYTAFYAKYHPHSFSNLMFERAPLAREVLDRIKLSVDQTYASQVPHAHLGVLVSLPRVVLLPSAEDDTAVSRRSAWASSPLSSLSLEKLAPASLDTLAVLFRGPEDAQLPEATAARALYALYISRNPIFWKVIVEFADAVALKDKAIAAIKVIRSIVDANWAVNEDIDSKLTLWMQDTNIPVPPKSGAMALLQPPAINYVLPYLMGAAKTFTNLVGGRGDIESAAYKVGMCKFETLKALYDRLQGETVDGQESDFRKLQAALRSRVEKGPWARERGLGERVATMEL